MLLVTPIPIEHGPPVIPLNTALKNVPAAKVVVHPVKVVFGAAYEALLKATGADAEIFVNVDVFVGAVYMSAEIVLVA